MCLRILGIPALIDIIPTVFIRVFLQQIIKFIKCQTLLGDQLQHPRNILEFQENRTVSLQNLGSLCGYPGLQYHCELISQCISIRRQCNAGVTTAEIHNGVSGLNLPLCLRILYHSQCRSVLHGTGRIEILQFCEHRCLQVMLLFIIGQFYQGGLSHQFCDGMINFSLCHVRILLVKIIVLYGLNPVLLRQYFH